MKGTQDKGTLRPVPDSRRPQNCDSGRPYRALTWIWGQGRNCSKGHPWGHRRNWHLDGRLADGVQSASRFGKLVAVIMEANVLAFSSEDTDVFGDGDGMPATHSQAWLSRRAKKTLSCHLYTRAATAHQATSSNTSDGKAVPTAGPGAARVAVVPFVSCTLVKLFS